MNINISTSVNIYIYIRVVLQSEGNLHPTLAYAYGIISLRGPALRDKAISSACCQRRKRWWFSRPGPNPRQQLGGRRHRSTLQPYIYHQKTVGSNKFLYCIYIYIYIYIIPWRDIYMLHIKCMLVCPVYIQFPSGPQTMMDIYLWICLKGSSASHIYRSWPSFTQSLQVGGRLPNQGEVKSGPSSVMGNRAPWTRCMSAVVSSSGRYWHVVREAPLLTSLVTLDIHNL